MPEPDALPQVLERPQGHVGLARSARQGAAAGGPGRRVRARRPRPSWWILGACLLARPAAADTVPSFLLARIAEQASACAQGLPAAAADTLTVTAPRETVAEVIAAIGERMRRQTELQVVRAHTSVTTVIQIFDHGGDGARLVREDAARRHRSDGRGGLQAIDLWRRRAVFIDGAWSAADTATGGPVVWPDPPRPLLEALPFHLGCAGRYLYAIEARRLVGNTLIYRIAFTPRHRFDALPEGRIWVDWTNWAIRKLEARLIGQTPSPLFLRGVPLYRSIQRRYGQAWLPADVLLVMDLQEVPLSGHPDRICIRTRLADVTIDGRPAPAGEGLAPGERDPRDPGEFWLDGPAAADSLAAFWSAVEADQALPDQAPIDQAPMDQAPAECGCGLDLAPPAPEPWEGPTPAVRDSLRRWADGELARAAVRGRPRPPRLRWGGGPWFNRAQGAVARAGLSVGGAPAGGGPAAGAPAARAAIALDAAYGAGCGRPEARLQASLASWPCGRLAANLEAAKVVLPFAGDAGPDGERAPERSAAALLYGGDPNHYRETRALMCGLTWRPRAQVTATCTAGWFQERPLPVATTWTAVGAHPQPAFNLQAAALDGRRLRLRLGWRAGDLRATAGWEAVRLSEPLTGSGGRSLACASLDLTWEGLDRWGNRWVLAGAHQRWDGPAPVQWQIWWGDWGSLRGRPAATLRGDGGQRVSLELCPNADPLRALGVPLPGGLRLQPLAFLDWARAGAAVAPAPAVSSADDLPGVTGSRLDGGVGLGWRLGLPALWERPWLRIYVGWPLAGGEGTGSGPRVVAGLGS